MIVPGDLVRPKKSYNVALWRDVVRQDDLVTRMSDVDGVSYLDPPTTAIVVQVERPKNALLLLVGHKLYWTWRSFVVAIHETR